MILAKAQHGPRIINNFSASARGWVREFVSNMPEREKGYLLFGGENGHPTNDKQIIEAAFIDFMNELQVPEPTLSCKIMFTKQWVNVLETMRSEYLKSLIAQAMNTIKAAA